MWRKVAKATDIGEGKSQTIPIGDLQIALFKTGGLFYAMDGACPHRGGSLGEGYLDGLEVTCPWHAWVFNVKSGECQTAPGTKQKCFPVKVEGQDVLVNV